MDDTERYGSTYGIAREGADEVADELAKEMPDEHGPTGLNESTVLAKAIASTPIDPNDPPRKLTDEERERLADEIEMDLL